MKNVKTLGTTLNTLKLIFIYNNISHRRADSKISTILIISLIINQATLRLFDCTVIPYQIKIANSTHK